MKTLQSLSGPGVGTKDAASEPRTMQFLVERVCPHVSERFKFPPVEKPYVMEVYLNRAYRHSQCGGVCYPTVSLDAMYEDGSRFQIPDKPPMVFGLCEHEGHLIE